MVGVGLLWWSWQLIGESNHPWTVPFLVLCNLWGLGTIVASWLPDSKWTLNHVHTNWLAWATAVLTVATFFAWSIYSLRAGLVYGTDAIAFNQYAAHLVQQGLNPYTHTMAPAFQMFQTPTSYYTYSFTGHPVTTISYPSLSFLVYVPFLLLGWSYNLAPALNLFAWGLTVVLMFAFLPKQARPVALLLGGFGLYAVFAMGGVTDALFMPLLTIVAYRWDRFGEGWKTYIGPVMFGLAMGIKQTPWPALPFILLALGCDEYVRAGLEAALRRAGKYLGTVLVVFLIPNLPYIIAAPSAWVKGTLTPLFANMVPTGQGTMSLSLYLHLGGGSMTAFTLATGVMAVLLVVAYVGTYPLMRVALFVLPAFIFFFAARSNVNYFISLIPAGFVAAVTARRPPMPDVAPNIAGAAGGDGHGLGGGSRLLHGQRALVGRLTGPGGAFRSRAWLIATAVFTVLFAASAAYSLTAQPPMSVNVIGVHATGTTNHIEALELRVTNTSGKPIVPSFDIMEGGFNSTFWIIQKRPPGSRVMPHSSADFEILAPNSGAEPLTYGGFNVVAYVDKPESFSVSPTYQPNLDHVGFNPQTVDSLIPVGKQITEQVQVYNRDGAEIHRAGIRVKLTSVIWGADGPTGTKARIDGGKTGKYAFAYTNAQGLATFRIVDLVPNSYPVTFSAFLYDKQFNYVYGTSGDLNIRFVKR
jgi:hypothetical protein